MPSGVGADLPAPAALRRATPLPRGRDYSCRSASSPAMSDTRQSTPVPDSFLALQALTGRPSAAALRECAERHELCEDMAQMLVEPARGLCHDLGVTEEDVLQRMQQGLSTEASVVSAAEAVWVVRRLAEVLGWQALR